MNCQDVAALIAADGDGEVDRLRSHAIARHLAGCAVCATHRAAAQSLRGRLRAELPYHRAPAALRARVVAPPGAARPLPDVSRWRWFGGGALSGAAGAGALALALLAWPPGSHVEGFAAQVVELHTRATLGNHLIDVASSDRHKVKPWLSARLDYAVPVVDWAAAGYPLAGARIDRLEGYPVGVLVYRRRDHVIDVVVRPAAAGAALPVARTVRGFNVAAAAGQEMEWVAASDLSAAELRTFIDGLATGTVRAPAD